MDFSQDELSSVLARIGRRVAGVYPTGSWHRVVTLISLRDPERIDVASFRRFQEAARAATGISPIVVGGVFGCVKLYVRLLEPDEEPSAPTHRVLAPGDDRSAHDPVRAFARALVTDAGLRALAIAAGISRVQTSDTSIDLRSGKVEAYGFGLQPLELRSAGLERPLLHRFDSVPTLGLPPASAAPGRRAVLERSFGAPLLPREPPESVFHFVMRGTATSGNAIVARSQAQLRFEYAVAPPDAIATVKSQKLEAARQGDIDIVLVATARGPLVIVGPTQGRAEFVAGKLKHPVSFELQAGAEPGAASVHVGYYVLGELIHETRIAISVVASIAAARDAEGATQALGLAPPGLGQLALTASAPPQQRIALSLSFADEKLRLELTDYKAGEVDFHEVYQSTRLSPTLIDGLLKRVHADLKDCYADLDFWGAFDGTIPAGEPGRIAAAALAETLEKVAVAGSRLNEDLREEPEIGKALEYVEANAMPGAVLNVSTDSTFFPWEMLYPKHRTSNMPAAARTDEPVDAQAFWGARFAIETEMRGIGSLLRLRNEHLARPPKVTLNLNPTINIAGAPASHQPVEVQRVWGGALKKLGIVDDINETCERVRPVVQLAATDATFIYVYCHGNAPDALGGVDEMLLLDRRCELAPRDLRKLPPYPGAPIIFLNSCNAGVSSPLNFSGFLKEFRTRNALGMIATSYSVPIAFAASFGHEVVQAYLNRQGSLAAEMLRVRREHLLERGDPVPLFYTLQCHLDVSAQAAEAFRHA